MAASTYGVFLAVHLSSVAKDYPWLSFRDIFHYAEDFYSEVRVREVLDQLTCDKIDSKELSFEEMVLLRENRPELVEGRDCIAQGAY